MEKYGIDAVPFKNNKMDEWRDSFRRRIQFLHEKKNLLITGGIDDVWVNPLGELIVVDYKVTSKNGEASLDAKLEFDVKFISYKGDDGWVDQTIVEAHNCLKSERIPTGAEDCDYRQYLSAAKEVKI